MKNESKLSKALEELKAEAERQNMSAEIIDNKVVIDGNKVIEVVDEPRTPVAHTPKDADYIVFHEKPVVMPMGEYKTGQERRRERRAKERKK